MIQTNMREIDMEDVNAEEYVKELKKFDATVAMINVGGIMASYDTEVEAHTKSKCLHGDSLLKIIEACKNSGIRVVARMDFSKIRREVYEKHKDWAYKTVDGKIVDYNGNVHACICGDFQQKKAFEIIKEVLEKFPVDGVFFNMGGFTVVDYSYNYHGICHCKACQKRFKEKYGLDLPEKDDMQNPAYGKYMLFKREVVAEYKDKMEKFIHSIRPDVAVFGSDVVRREANTEYKRPNQPWIYSASSSVRTVQNLGGAACSCPSVDFDGFYYRHVAVSPKLQSMRMWQVLANCGLLDYYIIGRLDNHEDKSGYPEIKKVFAFHKKHEKLFIGLKEKAEVLLVKNTGLPPSIEGNGWVKALTESHIPFHECDDSRIKSGVDLSAYKAVIVADVAMLSDESVEALDEYAKCGGTLVVVGASGMMDVDGRRRGRIPFESLGLPRVLKYDRNMLSAMLKLEKREHKLFPLMKNSELFYFGEEFLTLNYDENCKKYLKLIPPHRFGPPEMCYYTEVTEVPGIVTRNFGSGKAIYIPWKPGTLNIVEGYENTHAFINGVLTEFASLESVEAEPFTRMIEVTIAEKEGIKLVSLVNNSGSFAKSFVDPLPVYGIKLKIKRDKAPTSVYALSNGEKLECDYDGKYAIIKVNRLDEYEGVVIK